MTVSERRGRGRPVDPDLVQRRHADLVEAATEVFAEIGYTKAGIADITQRAGLGKGTFYQYFDSKKDVFDGVIDQAVNEVSLLIVTETRTLAHGSIDDLEQSIRTVATRLFTMADERPHAVRMLVEGIQDEDIRARLLGLSANLEATAAITLRHGVDAGALRADADVDFAAHLLLSLALGGLLRILRGDLTDPAVRAKYVESAVATARTLLGPQ
ncbi:TetR/AcrR family transcriptional regulator [Nocardia sp. NPDC049149]|uniref:TetR/AcrR family transcriptional regulator n=1 Tax=Nocardia sp. NPDC049149 TaxID=3364315 RepID=UPI00371A203A